MAGGCYTPDEDHAIADAVRAGALWDRDFLDLAPRLGRSAAALRERALRLGLIQRSDRAGAPTRPWSDSEISLLLKLRDQKTPQRQIAKIFGRSPASVRNRVAILAGRVIQPPPPRDYAQSIDVDRGAQTRACAKHARACLKAGGFWAFSERRVGAGKWAVCLPLLPPPAHLWGAGH
jgi:hypothetical protein